MIPLVSLLKETYLMKIPSEANTVFFTEEGDKKQKNKQKKTSPNIMQITLKVKMSK